jgi:hypothetical protein
VTIFSGFIVNPGAEAGSSPTGWTTRSGAAVSTSTTSPHSGTRSLRNATTSGSSKWDQEIDLAALDAGLPAAVDAGLVSIDASAWHRSVATLDACRGQLYVEFYDAAVALISSEETDLVAHANWTQVNWSLPVQIPALTRYVRIGTYNQRFVAVNLDSWWDDFEADISDDRYNDYPGVFEPRVSQANIYALASGEGHDVGAYQLVAYALAQAPADEVWSNTIHAYTLGAAETSSTFHDVLAHQLAVYALVKSFPDRRDLRAWTFTQDEHPFYVLQLGSAATLVYDKLTEQVTEWRSPDYPYWRGADGTDWAGLNICCDIRSGKIFKIDAEGRLDYETTPILSQGTGMVPARLREVIPCYAAEFTVSEGAPPPQLEAGAVGITLEFSDDTLSYVNAGEVAGEEFGSFTLFRWYSLGQIGAPGRFFRITDTGYARRWDGLDISVGESNG